MKKRLLLLGMVAFLGLGAVSCSADDMTSTDTTQADNFTIDNGDRDLPKPPQKP